MNDLTILFYTANLPVMKLTNHVLTILKASAEGKAIISISQKPMEFGYNICMSELTPCYGSIYKQILTGAKMAETKYVALAEDDMLYPKEHFSFRPPKDDVFYYSRSRWILTTRRHSAFYFHHSGQNLSTCIASRELLIGTIETRFIKYPDMVDEQGSQIGEPGRFESRFGLPEVGLDTFKTAIPVVSVNHSPSLGGKRRTNHRDKRTDELPFWGKADDLYRSIYGRL